MKALSDVVVLDFTHMLSGPYGTMLLADLGARTIKVEPIGSGEGTRKLLAEDPENSFKGMGAYFLTLNRNKQSVCVDLKSEEGRQIVHRLVEKADVVFDNFSRGVMTRLGLGHNELAVINPRIVTCSVTGFGETGPQPDRPAFDMVAQGMGGGMSITGEVDGRALRAGIPIGDLGGGVFGAMGVLAALHARERTGRGQHIDVSMLDVQISMLNYMATMFLLSGKNPGPVGNGHFVHVPYDTFRTQSRGIILAVITDNFWTSLVELLDDPELRDPRYETQPGRLADREFINRRIQAAFDRDTCEVWIERLQGKRIPCAPVNDFEHALGDPQVTARNMIVRVDHPDGGSIEMPGNPLKLSETHAETFTPPPLVGQHTNEILHAILGLSEAEISSLKQRGIVG